jgi:hypothetical protein
MSLRWLWSSPTVTHLRCPPAVLIPNGPRVLPWSAFANIGPKIRCGTLLANGFPNATESEPSRGPNVTGTGGLNRSYSGCKSQPRRSKHCSNQMFGPANGGFDSSRGGDMATPESVMTSTTSTPTPIRRRFSRPKPSRHERLAVRPFLRRHPFLPSREPCRQQYLGNRHALAVVPMPAVSALPRRAAPAHTGIGGRGGHWLAVTIAIHIFRDIRRPGSKSGVHACMAQPASIAAGGGSSGTIANPRCPRSLITELASGYRRPYSSSTASIACRGVIVSQPFS